MKTLVYGLSIRGNSHFKTGVECQDSNSFVESDFNDDPIKVITIADGHGGSAYFRSAFGSKFAIEVSKKRIYEFIRANMPVLDAIDDLNIDKNKKMLLETQLMKDIDTLKVKIIDDWKEKVRKHLFDNPVGILKVELKEITGINKKANLTTTYSCFNVSNDEKQRIGITSDDIPLIRTNLTSKDVSYAKENFYSMYGTTLLCAAIYKSHIFLLQLGDGDITVIDKDNKDINLSMRDKNLVGDLTYSMCSLDALKHFKSAYFRNSPKLIMLTTDGVGNAFDQKDALVSIAKECYSSITEEAEDFRTDIAESLLRGCSENSTDDCTIGLIAFNVPQSSYDVVKNSKFVENTKKLEEKLTYKNYRIDTNYYKRCIVRRIPLYVELRFKDLILEAFDNVKQREKYIYLIRFRMLPGDNLYAFVRDVLDEINSLIEQRTVYLCKWNAEQIFLSSINDEKALSKAQDSKFGIVSEILNNHLEIKNNISENYYDDIEKHLLEYVNDILNKLLLGRLR